MMRQQKPRYIPAGAMRVADKASDAVAYAYSSKQGNPCAIIYFGKQSKPISHVRYRDDAKRAADVERIFAGRRARCVMMAERHAEDKAFAHTYKVGDIFRTCWGYDQTNVEFFEITALIGKKMVELREIASASCDNGRGSERCVPQSGTYLAPRYAGDDRGQPIRRLAQNGRVKIDECRTGYPWGTRVAGVIVGEPANRTASGWGH